MTGRAAAEAAPGLPGAQPSREGAALAAFTVDVEDWYQSTVDVEAPITERVVDNVSRILAMLDRCDVKGTFFVQGMVALRFPSLVQRLVVEGHEVQSHGHSHRPLYAMDRPALEQELDAARKSVEDAAGLPVTAFRAPDFSILRGNLWALEVLAERGFRVDSSIFPVASGVTASPVGRTSRNAFDSRGEGRFWRCRSRPGATAGSAFRSAAAGTSGCFLPILLRGLESRIALRRPPVVYCHPYEFNGEEMGGYRTSVPWPLRFHQGLGRNALAKRMERLLRKLPFGRLDRVLEEWGFA